jgi:F0F1-type ATP synthase assembly protein I
MKNDSWNVALRIIANISGWIAFPVIFGLYLGKWLDKKYGTEPWLFLVTIAACFLISMAGLSLNAVKEFKQVEKDYQQAKKEKNELRKKRWLKE